MKFEDIKHVAVIGAGDMGHGIAQVSLMAGYTVSMYDIKDEFVERGKGRIEWKWEFATRQSLWSLQAHGWSQAGKVNRYSAKHVIARWEACNVHFQLSKGIC